MLMPLEHRLQILIDEERHQRIVRVARERGVSVATVVREAIDRGLGPLRSPPSRRATSSGCPDMPVPDPAELRAELEALRARRT